MTEYIGKCINGDNIKRSLRPRAKTYIEKTISASTHEDLEKKLILEEKEGWTSLRKNQKSYRLKLEKRKDEQLEDELWCLVARMGFTELSDGRQFKISVGKELEPRQVDVFAKDDECALFIECTQCEKPTKKNMSPLLEKISAINNDVTKSVRTHYGMSEPLKMRWLIATRRVEWTSADLKKARESKIVVLRDLELDYFAKLTNHIKTAARYQLLAQVFRGEGIKGLANQVLATKGNMGGIQFYNFLMRPSELMKLAYISHKASGEVDAIETYQRMLKPARLKKIKTYIENGGQFPTNIVVNIKTRKKRPLVFDRKLEGGSETIGMLHLPTVYSCAWIIDGQHRLYGYAHSNRSEKPDDKTTYPVLAYVNLPPAKEAQLFVDINSEQVRVQKNLLLEIYGTLNWGSENRDEQIEALRFRLAFTLDRSPSSPLYNRVITSANQKHGLRCLTTTSFSDGLQENKFFGETTPSGDFNPGPFWASYTKSKEDVLEETLEKAKETISGYLGFFAKQAQEHWGLGDGPGGFLATNVGIRTTFRVLKHILEFCEKENFPLRFHSQDAQFLIESVEKYCRAISEHFEGASIEEAAAYRQNSSLAGVKENSLRLMAIIKEANPEFTVEGLEEYINSRDEIGTREARDKVITIQKRINEFVLGKLKEHYGDGETKPWWYDGVPFPIRRKCTDEHEAKKGKGKPENYLYLQHYIDIVSGPGNWSNIFQQSFSYPKTQNMRNKRKDIQLKWMKDLNDIRNQLAHPERGALDTDQVTFVRDLHEYVEMNLSYKLD